MSRVPSPLLHYILLPLLAVATLAAARADATHDLDFTDFRGTDPATLSGGKVLQARGGLLDFQRGISAQSLCMIDAPIDVVRTKFSTWNPANHSDLQVWMHKALPARPTAADFSGLQTLPNNSSVNYLINATGKLDPANPNLQVDKSEAALIASLRSSQSDPRTLFTSAWSQIMAARVSRFLSGNFTADQYEVSGGNITSLSEITSLLRSNSYVYARFHPLLAQTPIYRANKLAPVSLYYESFDVEGGAVLGTGAMYQTLLNGAPPVNNGPGTVLVADIEYFLNNGIYVSLELEQLTPVNINGRNETMVWRDDLVSTSNVAYLHGTERLASGMIMLQDVKQAIDAFRSEFK